MRKFTILLATAALAVAFVASPAYADRDDHHGRGHAYGHERHHWAGRDHHFYGYPTVVYRSYGVPVYYTLVPPPTQTVIYRQSGFGFWWF